MPKYQPASEDSLAEAGLLPKGEYPFRVTKATESVSKKSGAEMIDMTLAVYDPQGNAHEIRSFLVFSENIYCQRTISQFCKSVGIDYSRGEITAQQCHLAEGMVAIKIKVDESGQYAPKNEVAYFVVGSSASPIPPAASPSQDEDSDEDIPF